MYGIATCEKCRSQFEVEGSYRQSTAKQVPNDRRNCIAWHQQHSEDMPAETGCPYGKKACDDLTSQWRRT